MSDGTLTVLRLRAGRQSREDRKGEHSYILCDLASLAAQAWREKKPAQQSHFHSLRLWEAHDRLPFQNKDSRIRPSYLPITGTDRPRHTLIASLFGISECLGTASTAPVAGLHHSECARPSRFRKHP